MLIPCSDAHSHTDPVNGIGAYNIARRFKSVGGWFIALVSLSPLRYGFTLDIEGYLKMFELMIKECWKVKELGLKTACIVGLHPADVDKLVNTLGPDKALELSIKILDLIARLCKEGKVSGIGEVGRQHYITKPQSFLVSEHVMEYALEISRDLDVPLHLHLEQAGKLTALDIDKRLRRLGYKHRCKVIIHHADPKVSKAAIEYGISVTVTGRYENLRRLKDIIAHVMIESDFLDDPKRPGVVMYPWDIPKNVKKLLDDDIVDEKVLYKTCVENVCRVYGVEYS